jgi:nitroimidazol reductase NimA-like FMN-containing flavoprotein (pyridoxamine 5'-phosphate oxidase superfamily)
VFTDAENRFLMSQWVCRIATASSDGWPHNVPVGFAFDGESFYITSDPGAKKLMNMAKNNRVCLIIDVPEKPRRAIMVQGLATLFERGEEFERINDIMSKKWKMKKKWKEGEQVAVRIEPKKKVSWGI